MFFLNCLFGKKYLKNPNLGANIPPNTTDFEKHWRRDPSSNNNKTPCKIIHPNSSPYNLLLAPRYTQDS